MFKEMASDKHRVWEDDELRRCKTVKVWLRNLVQIRSQPTVKYVTGTKISRVAFHSGRWM